MRSVIVFALVCSSAVASAAGGDLAARMKTAQRQAAKTGDAARSRLSAAHRRLKFLQSDHASASAELTKLEHSEAYIATVLERVKDPKTHEQVPFSTEQNQFIAKYLTLTQRVEKRRVQIGEVRREAARLEIKTAQ